jgi:hypothetical protein
MVFAFKHLKGAAERNSAFPVDCMRYILESVQIDVHYVIPVTDVYERNRVERVCASPTGKQTRCLALPGSGSLPRRAPQKLALGRYDSGMRLWMPSEND